MLKQNKAMDTVDFDGHERPPLPGFRLQKLEVYNWGTFDGKVYSVLPQGETTLLVGENGSGKSTLVDALLTLLVRPNTRNYNVAAGATKNERDEKTYIRGAYDRTVGEGGRPQIQYLRSGQGHYTALLACFQNATLGISFTVSQILYLNTDGSVEKVYAFAEGEHGIVQDLAKLKAASNVAKHLRSQGYQTTNSYKQYLAWIQRKAGFRDKAMDVFNQTVAVKDVQRLDLFIRQHMLEIKPWKDRVDRLLNHFTELSEAHRSLTRVRQQEELLRPLAETALRYSERQAELATAQRRLEASEHFFAYQRVELLKPLVDHWTFQIQSLNDEIGRIDALQTELRNSIARTTIDIEGAGGDHLKQLPHLIAHEEALQKVKLTAFERFESQLNTAGLRIKITSPDQFTKAISAIRAKREEWSLQRQNLRLQASSLDFEIGTLKQRIAGESAEVAAARDCKSNLPESLLSMREHICKQLELTIEDLPFAAELIAVAQEESDWEASIEHVLYGFARSLLVPDKLYARVARFIDQTRLKDARGNGQRLVYLRVLPTNNRSRIVAKGNTLASKLLYRTDHSLSSWMQEEIERRFDYSACDTIEEFQRVNGAAMTKHRHFKSNLNRHEKDDRSRGDDARYFVLGWDRKSKEAAVSAGVNGLMVELNGLMARSEALSSEIDHASEAIGMLDQALAFKDYESIDYSRHEFEASRLRLEKQQLEDSSDLVGDLKGRRKKLEAEVRGYTQDRDDLIARRTTLATELKSGSVLLKNSQKFIDKHSDSDTAKSALAQFNELSKMLGKGLSIENITTLPYEFESKLRDQRDKLQSRLAPISRELTSGMTRFLKRFPDEQSDLDADVASLSSFMALYERIANDDLPKHELRFRQRLNEKVLHEVGLLHGSLENDCDEIRGKIDQLNSALRMLEWKPGTFMRLELSDVADREIQDFRREIASCLSGTLDGIAEANEATFGRLERLVAKLRDEGNERWRAKVVDVRNWFNFAAREIVEATGEARSHYDGGTGQSGGEKGKLAFLVLVAAIAYQYDLDPHATNSDKFHFVMIDEMFSRSDDQHAEYALDLFERFGLQILIVAPLDAKARVTEPYVGTYLHVVKNKETHRSELVSVTAEALIQESSGKT